MIQGNPFQLGLLILLSIDFLVRPPHGFLRKLVGYTDHGDINKPCAWDLEGRWQIGTIWNGTSPWQWEQGSNDVSEKGGMHPLRGSYSTFRRRRVNAKLDVITCADLGNNPAASFVADPFMIKLSTNEWYMFFEFKNLARYIGEIGVSKSSDGGQSWEFQGVALKDTHHLSYPFVVKDETRNKYYLLPEINKANEVRLYETSSSDFPFGWKHVHTPLKGRFVDTAAVWYGDRYWIYTTELPARYMPLAQRKSTLRLYYTEDLVQVWKEHRLSPIVVNNRQIGRSGGRPVVYQDNVYRFAQDGTNSYGEGIHVIRAHVLTPELYQEQQLAFISPGDVGAARFHHLDAHVGDDGVWFAFIDTDENEENHEFMKREWRFHYFKRILLFCLVLYTLFGEMKRFHLKCTPLIHEMHTQCAAEEHNTICPVFAGVRRHPLIILVVKASLLFVCSFLLAVASSDMKLQCVERASLSTSECFNEEKTNLYLQDSGQVVERDMMYSSSTETFKKNSSSYSINTRSDKSHNGTDEMLVVVTAASPGYMERLRNLVGSIHFWEPGTDIEIYDLGLSEVNLYEIAQWKRVKVLPLPFEKYPSHVSLLYNMAWKIVLLHEAIQLHPRLIYFDSGIEIRRPLSDVRYFLERDGYYGIHLQVVNHPLLVGKQTHRGTYSKLREIGIEVDEDQMSKVPFCAGGVTGLVRGKVESLLEPALSCALDKECIAPIGSGRRNHDYDQSVLSVVAYSTGRGKSCHVENVVDWNQIDYTVDETRCNKIQMGTRRWRRPKNYIKHINTHLEKKFPTSQKGNVMAIESKQVGMFKPQPNSTWQKCVSECGQENTRGAWEVCAKSCPMDSGREGIVFINVVAELDYLWNTVRKGLQCKRIIFKSFLFFLLYIGIMTLFLSRQSKKVALSKDV